MQRLHVTGLPEAPSAAAALFYSQWLGQAQAMLAKGDALALVFPPASHEHTGWRLSAVRAKSTRCITMSRGGATPSAPWPSGWTLPCITATTWPRRDRW